MNDSAHGQIVPKWGLCRFAITVADVFACDASSSIERKRQSSTRTRMRLGPRAYGFVVPTFWSTTDLFVIRA